MATYVPGVPQYFPKLEPFTPDYKFLSSVLDSRTDRYNKNYKAVNDLYSKVVYGNLSRQDTKSIRNQYAENLGPKLQQVSGMDLSMVQNTEAAKSLFKPFFEDDLIVKDLVTTRQYQNEMSYVNQLQNSPDRQQREMYWTTGLKKMQFEMEDFINASEQDAIKMSAPKYTPDADLYEMAMEHLKASGLTADITEPSKDGMWNVRRKNGDLITRQALQDVQMSLKDDPRVVNAYYADSFVRSRDFASKGMEAGQFANVKEGQAAWAKEQVNRVEKLIATKNVKLKDENAKFSNIKVDWENYSKTYGINPGSDEEKAMNESMSLYEATKAAISGNNNALSDNKGVNEEDFQGLLNRAHSLLMHHNMEGDLQAAAIAYSNIDKVVEMKESTLQKEKIKFRFDMAKLKATQAGNERLAAIKHANKLKETDYELAGGELGLKLQQALGGSSTTYGQAGSIDLEKDKKGNTVLDEDFDALSANQQQAADQFDNMKGDMVDTAMDAYINIFSSGQKGGIYKITGDGYSFEGDRESIKKQFMNHDDKIEGFFTDMQEEMIKAKASSGASKSNGGAMFYARNNGQDYNALYKRMNSTYTKRQGVDGALGYVYNKGNENLIKLLKLPADAGMGNEHEDLVRVLSQSESIPKIFALGGADGDPHTKLLTEEEYVKAFQDWAKENGANTDVENTIFDTSRWSIHNANERTQLSDGTNAGFGYGQDLSANSVRTLNELKNAGDPEVDNLYSEDSRALSYQGEFKFQPELAAFQARKLYALQKQLVNSTLNGSMNRVGEEMYKDEEGNTEAYIPMFDEANFSSVMLGVSDANMTAGDIELSPTTTVSFDPLMLTEEGVNMIGNLNAQFRNTDKKELYIVGGNYISDEEGDYTKGDLIEASEDSDVKRRVLENYLTEIVRMQAKGATKSNYPKATISYTNNTVSQNYLEDAEESPERIGSYTIKFGPDFLDQYSGSDNKLKTLGIDDGDLEDIAKNGITIAFPSEKDINPSKYGEYNFSSVATEITTSAESAYHREVSRGGMVEVQRDQNGQYIASYEPLLYNNSTGRYDTLPMQYQNLGGDRYGLDQQVNKLLDGIRVIQQKNIQREMGSKKSNK
ncbi:hypothetical protein N9926_01005 [Flavobacteriaceae bacterium]|nr:hypothetical protein [Flavobacteriaceae bacterium]